MMIVRVDELKEIAGTWDKLIFQLRAKGVNVQQKTLFNWRKGRGFQSKKVEAVCKAMGYDNPLDLIDVV